MTMMTAVRCSPPFQHFPFGYNEDIPIHYFDIPTQGDCIATCRISHTVILPTQICNMLNHNCHIALKEIVNISCFSIRQFHRFQFVNISNHNSVITSEWNWQQWDRPRTLKRDASQKNSKTLYSVEEANRALIDVQSDISAVAFTTHNKYFILFEFLIQCHRYWY